MGNKEQRIFIKMTTDEAESLISRLEVMVEEARDHGLNQLHIDQTRNIEIAIVLTKEDRIIALDKLIP